MSFHRVGPPVPGVGELDIDGNVSVYHPTIDEVLVLNGTASDVWRLCTGEHSLAEIVTLLSLAYQVDDVHIRHEVEEIVTRLERQGILVIDRAP
ncbi:MAG: PqqD family protein [Actinobacteria bacterium]|nr:PqqD family protein [Actinomycetota bacterium]